MVNIKYNSLKLLSSLNYNEKFKKIKNITLKKKPFIIIICLNKLVGTRRAIQAYPFKRWHAIWIDLSKG